MPPRPINAKEDRHFVTALARGLEVNNWNLTPRRYGAARVDRAALHIGVDSQPPHIAPARDPPLWQDGDAQVDDGLQIEADWATDWDGAAQPAADFDVDQRVNW